MPTFASGFVNTAQILDSAVTSAKVADGAIVNADINTSAAIAYSKLAALTSANLLVGNSSNVPTSTAVTGDVTISNTGVTTIGASKVTEAMQVLADNTTNDVASTRHGYAPKFPNNTTTFLRGDGTYAAPSGSSTVTSGQGSSTNTAGYDDLQTYSISASQFTVNDKLVIHTVESEASTSGVDMTMTINDGTNTFTSDNSPGVTTEGTSEFIFWQGNEATTQLVESVISTRGTTIATNFKNSVATMIANWLAAASTLKIRGRVYTSGTGYFKWIVQVVRV